MKVYGRTHVYRYVPNFLNNRQLPKDQQIVIRSKAVGPGDEDAYQREALNNTRSFAPDKAQELNEARLHRLFTEKYDGVENLEIEGLEGKEIDFQTFYVEAPGDIVNEFMRSIRSVEALTAGEQKNFLPESGGL